MGFGPEGKDRFPFGKKDRESHTEFYKDVTADQAETERMNESDDVYTIYDAPLSGFGSDSSFDITFSKLFESQTKTLRWYVESALENKKGNAVGIEFGGPGSQLFAGFSKNFFARSLGVALTDMRNLEQKKSDMSRHHDVLEGDMADLQTYDRVAQWLAQTRADIIIERLAGGHALMPREPHLLGRIFQRWYGMLSDEGIIIAQTSDWMRPILVPWYELVKHKCARTLELVYEHGWGSQSATFDAILLRKLPGAPENLPMLEPRTIREISKNDGSNWV